jgi:hypothetical protein
MHKNLLSTYRVHRVNAHTIIRSIEEAVYGALLVLTVEHKLNILANFGVSYSEKTCDETGSRLTLYNFFNDADVT